MQCGFCISRACILLSAVACLVVSNGSGGILTASIQIDDTILYISDGKVYSH